MDQDLLTARYSVRDILLMAAIFTKKHLNVLCLSIFFLIIVSSEINAQQILMGLTSNGGTQGKGTIFTIKTDATAFTITKALPDWGKTPWGDLLNGNDGFYYGTS